MAGEKLQEAGFSLLELLAAMTLFSVIVVGFVYARNNAITQAGEANDNRILRYLAGYQIGYLRLGYDPDRDEYDVGDIGGDFAKLDEGRGPESRRYDGYRWEATIEEMIIAGRGDDDEEGEYLFEEPEDEEEEEEEGDPVKLLRITLRIYHELDDVLDGVEPGLQIVTFKPLPPEDAAEDGEGG